MSMTPNSDGGVNLEWCPPLHISVHDVKGFKEEFQIAEVTGVFDCFVKGDELSDELTSDSVWYEVEAELSKEAAQFFGFRQNEPGRFKFPAESLWAIPAGVPLATAYELYYVATNGEWGHSMSVAERVQGTNAVVLSEVRKITSQGLKATEDNCEIAYLWLKAVAKLAAIRLRQEDIQDMLYKVKLLQQHTKSKAPKGAGLRGAGGKSVTKQMLPGWFEDACLGKFFVTQAIDSMPVQCKMFDADVQNIKNMQVLGQLSQVQTDGSSAVFWILGEPIKAISDLGWTISDNFAVFFLQQASSLWRTKFKHKSLTKSLHAYGDWHQEMAGESPAKRLGSVRSMGTPVVMHPNVASQSQDVMKQKASEHALLWLGVETPDKEALQWLGRCENPVAALQAVANMLEARACRAFRHWMAVSIWQTNLKRDGGTNCMLMCGEAVWCAVVRRSSVDNESCWFADGEISFPKEESLSVFNPVTDQALLGLAPNHEDYTIRRLPIPDRLASLAARDTPVNFKGGSDEVDLVMQEQITQVSNDLDWLEEYHSISPLVSGFNKNPTAVLEDSSAVLYLANDFHWRSGEILEASGEGLVLVRFACKDKDVQVSRCITADQNVAHIAANQLATADDFVSRGLQLPYGYYLERTYVRWERQSARRRLTRYFQAWAEPEAWEVPDCDFSVPGNGQYKRSQQCDVIPDFPKVASAQQVSIMLETGVFVEQFVKTDHIGVGGNMGAYVCVSQGQRYLISQNRFPPLLKRAVNSYRMWHVTEFGTAPEDFTCQGTSKVRRGGKVWRFGIAAEDFKAMANVLVVKQLSQLNPILTSQGKVLPGLLDWDSAPLCEADLQLHSRMASVSDYLVFDYNQDLAGLTYEQAFEDLIPSETMEAARRELGGPGNSSTAVPLPVEEEEYPGESVRIPAYFSKQRCDFQKLCSSDNDLVQDAVVFLLTEVKLKGRPQGYAEYQFLMPDGSKRRLSARDKMATRVKELVNEYEKWHIREVGLGAVDWIKDQSVYDSEDDEEEVQEDMKAAAEDMARQFPEEADEDSEPEDLDDSASCRQVAEKDLLQRGLSNFDRVRHIDTWPEDIVTEFAETGDVAILPPVDETIRQLAGKPVLLYEMVASHKERVTMSVSDRLDSWFALGAKVVGEASESTLKVPKVVVHTISGPSLPKREQFTVAVRDLHKTMRTVLETLQEADADLLTAATIPPVSLLVSKDSMLTKYAGLNLQQKTYKEWLGVKNAVQAGWNGGNKDHSDEEVGEDDEGFAKALKKMHSTGGRDFFEEAMIEAERRKEEEKAISQARNSNSTATLLYGVDQRAVLSSQDMVLQRSRCPIYVCHGILEKFDSECCTCECPRLDLCQCEQCGQPYNPNRHKKCGTPGCARLFPHHSQFYRQKSLAKDDTEADKDSEKLTAVKLEKKVDSIRYRKVLQDKRGEPSERLMNETNPLEVSDILCRMATTAAEDVTFNRPPIEDFTAGVSYDMVVKSSKALYGVASKGRLSMWQFLPKTGPWKKTWYMSNNVPTTKVAMSATEIKALGCAQVDIRTFMEAGENYSLWLREVANSKLAEEVEEMVRILDVYHRATLPTARLKKCTVALLFDAVDFMMDLATDFLTEQADCQRAKRSIEVTYSLMKRQFPDMTFSIADMHKPLPLVVRELCSRHQESLTLETWPQDAWECSGGRCCWHPRLKRQLESFQEGAVPVNERAALIRGLIPRTVSAGTTVGGTAGTTYPRPSPSAPPATPAPKAKPVAKGTPKEKLPNDMHFTDNECMYHVVVGGNRDKLKADWDGQRFEHMRVAKLITATHTKKAEAQLVEFFKGKLPDKIIPCMCQGSALGCLRDTCPYDHTWSTKITEPELKALKMYYAWCIAKADGTLFEYNVTWMTLEEAKNQRTKKLALTIKVNKLIRDSGYGPHNAPADPVDPSASNTVHSRTRSKTRGGVGGSTAEVRQLTSEERAALIRSTRGASSFNEQATLAACDKVEVAEEGRLQGYPDLLPDKNVSLIWKSLTSADWPSQTLGNVQVQSMSTLTVETHDVPTLGKYGFSFFIIDGGQHIEMQLRKCDTIAMQMAYRVQHSLAQTDKALEHSARTWFKHYGDSGAEYPSWQAVIAHLQETEIPEKVWRHEASIVKAQLSRGQPVSPDQSSMLMQDFARGVVEAKMFEDKHGNFHISLGVPADCITSDESVRLDVPIVFRYYTDTHACAAVCRSFSTGTTTTVFHEDWRVLNAATWQGMTVGQLIPHIPFMQGHFNVEWHAAQTVSEVLQRDQVQFPSFVHQMSRGGRNGNEGGSAIEELGSRKMGGGGFNMNTRCHEQKLAITPKGMDVKMLSSTRAVAVGGIVAQEAGAGERSAQRWSQLSKVAGVKVETQLKLHCLRMVSTAVKDLAAWKMMKDFINTGKQEQGFDGSILCNGGASKRPIDWKEVRNLLQQASTAAQGRAVGAEAEEQDMVEVMGCLVHLREFAGEKEEAMPSQQDHNNHVVGADSTESLTAKQAELLFIRAVLAVSVHRKRALTKPQNSPDPGQEWLLEHGELMESVVKWMEVAYPKVPDKDRIIKLEEVFRAVEHMGKPAEHMNYTVVDSHMGDLPEALRNSLRDTMQYGVKTGIPRPNVTNEGKPTSTAKQYASKIELELRKSTVHGWVRAFPPSMREKLKSWGLLISVIHYVPPPNDRMVTDATGSGANETSPESEHGYAKERVQCDYIDTVVKMLVEYLELGRHFTDLELISVKADIKSAFMRIPLHVDSMGCFAMEWQGWIFVFNRTCFGWKYATHTFSDFTKAIKLKTQAFNRNGWQVDADHKQASQWHRVFKRLSLHSRLPADLQKKAAASWMDFLALAYVDDVWAHTFKDLGRAAKLAAVLRVSGYLLLGYNGWNIPKAEKDGFFSVLHKYSGVGFNTSDPNEITLFFTRDRLEKNLHLALKAEEIMAKGDKRFRLDFARSVHGNWVWFIMVYKMLKGTASGWRRCLGGVETTARADTMVGPGRDGENEGRAIQKHRKDNAMNIFCLRHLLKSKEEMGEGKGRDVVALTALRQITHQDIHSSQVVGRITGDASKMCWSVLNPMTGEALCIKMPPAYQHAIEHAGNLPKDNPLHLFIMAIAELAVCPMAQMQWGHQWRSKHLSLVLFCTDNQNAKAWTDSMFANNDLAQEICRLISSLCFTEMHTIRSLWWPTYINKLADLISRLLDENGREIPSVRQEFEEENAKLERPYRILADSEVDPRIASFVDWMGGLDHAFSVLQGIPLESDLASNKSAKGDAVGGAPDSPGIRSGTAESSDIFATPFHQDSS